MEQQFQLKYHGNLDLFEQNMMPAEDRAWWMKRIEKEMKDRLNLKRIRWDPGHIFHIDSINIVDNIINTKIE